MNAPGELEQFINLFVSYLTTSFELVDDPEPRTVYQSDGCPCELCSRLVVVAGSHLQTRQIRAGDKARALVLKREYLRELARAVEVSAPDELVNALIAEESTSEAVALATYGSALVRRSHGAPGEPAILVLWRQFAWNPSGGLRRGFVLTADLILESERALARHLTCGSVVRQA